MQTTPCNNNIASAVKKKLTMVTGHNSVSMDGVRASVVVNRRLFFIVRERERER
jgi:hypothetical protein